MNGTVCYFLFLFSGVYNFERSWGLMKECWLLEGLCHSQWLSHGNKGEAARSEGGG